MLPRLILNLCPLILKNRKYRGITMPKTQYDLELERLSQTYNDAMQMDIASLKKAIAGSSEFSLIGVGSGGSFTVASLLCSLHESYTGRVSRPSTPLEIICNPTLASTSPVFLISAEGKNPDITEAMKRARHHSARTVHVISNKMLCPLIEEQRKLTDVKSHIYEFAQKDGYLATNSILLNSVVIARAYEELDHKKNTLPNNFDELKVGGITVSTWISEAFDFINEAVKRKALTIVYSPLLRPIAIDLESKLSEGALLHVQISDLRSYAHGRHLWLSERPHDCAILALVEPSLGNLWNGMRSFFPKTVPTYEMKLDGAEPKNLIAGLVAQMYFIGEVGRAAVKDPAKPKVADLGRSLYYMPLPEIIPPPTGVASIEASKYDVIGAHWPTARKSGVIKRSCSQFTSELARKNFRAVIFDYDGTLCSSQQKDEAPSPEVLNHISALVKNRVIVGIASGRGGSIQEKLIEALPAEVMEHLVFGLYNGGAITKGNIPPTSGHFTSEFLSHVSRIISGLKKTGAPIIDYKTTQPYQVSVKFREGLHTANMWFVIADSLKQAGLDLSRIVKSKHSVDILANNVNKSRLIAEVIQNYKVDPYDILTIGDQGAWPGNDSSLLEHKFSLSVDEPSRRLDRGWKLAPSHKRDVDATVWYLEKMAIAPDGTFTIDLKGSEN